ncbi:hypothetical protein [Methanococcoides sp. AM1]|uniref:hypothetical protein n=1 Tax=Methanococcoides sp. AM1 TaxID=1201011 RepID=UPI0010827D6F|nr:hypothetical protein [Methanococcoides sp. AM1]
MDFIDKLKDKQKDQSAKNWFDLGLQTKSLDKKVQYFTKCLLIEPENVQALRHLANAQEELGMIDAAMGSRARADDIEGSTGMFTQEPGTYNENDAFGSSSFTSDTMALEEEEQFVEENTFSTPESNGSMSFDTSLNENDQGIEIPSSNNEKWAIFEIAKENEAKKEEENFTTNAASFSQQETNVVVEELNETEDQPASPTTPASVPEEAPTRTKPEPVVVKKQTEQKAATPVREQTARQPVAQASAARPTPVTSSPAAVPQAMPQCSIPEPVAMKLPMGEIIKFWIVGAVVLIIVGMIMNYLTV